MRKMRVGVVGCGKISSIYLKNMIQKFPQLEVVACCAQTFSHAAQRAEEYGIEARTYEQILADKTIDMVVVLTPVPAHYELIRAALLAGKHVYTEKTMCGNVEQAKALVELASRQGLYLGSAPDTFLGAAWQKARQTVDSGVLGEVTSFHIAMNRSMDRAASKFPFLRLPGGGICYDMGVYYLTALVNLLGPIREVCAVVENRKPIRTVCLEDAPDYGQSYAFNNEAQVTALVRTESGVTGTININAESIAFNRHDFCIYGTESILQLPDPNAFGGEVTLIRSKMDQQVLENDLPYRENSRGIGPAEMAAAIAEGRPNRASGALALHVLDVIESMMESSKQGGFVTVQSRCKQPEAFY